MPIFEYKCTKCGHVTEVLARSGAAKPKCAKCGSGATEKLLSSFAAQSATPSKRCASCPDGTCPIRPPMA